MSDEDRAVPETAGRMAEAAAAFLAALTEEQRGQAWFAFDGVGRTRQSMGLHCRGYLEDWAARERRLSAHSKLPASLAFPLPFQTGLWG